MIRIIINSVKHLYYGSELNYKVAQIEGYFRSRKIEKRIKERGDTVLMNRSCIAPAIYTTKTKYGSSEIHGGAYRFQALYTTQQQIDDIKGYSSNLNELEDLIKVFCQAEAKVRAKNENRDI